MRIVFKDFYIIFIFIVLISFYFKKDLVGVYISDFEVDEIDFEDIIFE